MSDAAPECRSCGASVPSGQTKCRFCLSNHIDPSNSRASSTTEWRLLHAVHFLVEASSADSALAKGAAAAELLADGDADAVVGDCRLVDAFDEPPALQLTDQWPALPAAVRVRTALGERVLDHACDRTVWRDSAHSSAARSHATYLYDEGGRPIRDKRRLDDRLEEASDDWLVPAIALQRDAEDVNDQPSDYQSLVTRTLDCRECARSTDHRFCSIEELPNEHWSGQPVWGCQRCGTHRYGPHPSDER
ncbi:hypothetical protein [Halomarina litorea]|uniref:hypothetical protein n=1 Tax=Halomarina litorea TaxID=2961595 RepID=UPI0020C54A39|nr:hypothetical protein [Halomarina sp. BCD28]